MAPAGSSEDEGIVFCITSHNRLDCARILIEILKCGWPTSYRVVHASSSGDYEPGLEDSFVRLPPMPLHSGAINLLKASMRLGAAVPGATHLVHLEADTWLMRDDAVRDLVNRMDASGSPLAASAWTDTSYDRIGKLLRRGLQLRERVTGRRAVLGPPRTVDLSTQFFIMRNCRSMTAVIEGIEATPGSTAEIGFYKSFKRQHRLREVVRIEPRNPMTAENRYVCSALDLHCEHWPAASTSDDTRSLADPLRVAPGSPGKREALLAYGMRPGPAADKLLSATDLTYYNLGALRH